MIISEEKISDSISVTYATNKDKKEIYVNDNDNEFLLLSVDGSINCGYSSNDYYIAAFSINDDKMPILQSVYSIKNKKMVDLSDIDVKIMLDYMLGAERGFSIKSILRVINLIGLDIRESVDEAMEYDSEANGLINYLTLENQNIRKEDVINYILNYYPNLSIYEKAYTITDLDYSDITDIYDGEHLYFNAMPQDLEEFREINYMRPKCRRKNIFRRSK